MIGSIQYYQQEIEKLYGALADIVRQPKTGVYFKGSTEVDYVDEPNLLVFEDILCSEEYCGANEAALLSLTKMGHKILLNFRSSDNVLGNVIIRIRDRWFAFGECSNHPDDEGPFVTQIWPLKYVLPRIRQMETKPACVIDLADIFIP